MRPMPLVRLGAAMAAVLAMTACKEGGTTPDEPLASRYVLTQVEGTGRPLIIGEFTHPSGTRQVYTMVYDSLTFGADGQGRRSFMMAMETLGTDGEPIVGAILTPVAHNTGVTRRRGKVILEYDTHPAIRADTFTINGANLVKQGPHGVSCEACAPMRRVEYVYEPR